MRLPNQSKSVRRGMSTVPLSGAIEPLGCNIFKAAACATALVTCGAVCAASLGTACVQCLAGIGAGGCIDCL
jgi:hypothetical protein